MSCDCGSASPFERCCGALHADVSRGGLGAPSPEALMRSRYSAFVRSDVSYLLATWHPATRPAADTLQPDPGTRWLGLQVKRSTHDGDAGTVEFIARFKVGGKPAVRLHETSRFVREDGRWFYVDGAFS